MKLVIDIPEEILRSIRERDVGNVIYQAIKNGTPLSKGYDSIKMVTNAEEAEEYPISEYISKGFEEFTKMMFKQGQAESEDKK